MGIEPTTLGLLDPRSNQLSYASTLYVWTRGPRSERSLPPLEDDRDKEKRSSDECICSQQDPLSPLLEWRGTVRSCVVCAMPTQFCEYRVLHQIATSCGVQVTRTINKKAAIGLWFTLLQYQSRRLLCYSMGSFSILKSYLWTNHWTTWIAVAWVLQLQLQSRSHAFP